MNRTAPEKASPMSLDFPRSGEVVTAANYTLRVSAAEHSRVRVSIDGGPWQTCRRASGFWWYDWTGYHPGYHLLSVQAADAEGRIVALEARHVSVDFAGDDAAAQNPLSAAVIRRRRRHA